MRLLRSPMHSRLTRPRSMRIQLKDQALKVMLVSGDCFLIGLQVKYRPSRRTLASPLGLWARWPPSPHSHVYPCAPAEWPDSKRHPAWRCAVGRRRQRPGGGAAMHMIDRLKPINWLRTPVTHPRYEPKPSHCTCHRRVRLSSFVKRGFRQSTQMTVAALHGVCSPRTHIRHCRLHTDGIIREHGLWAPAAAQPILVHMSKDANGRFAYSPVSVNFLTECAKCIFAVLLLVYQDNNRQPGERALLTYPSLNRAARTNMLLMVPALLYAINNYLKFAMQLFFKPATVKMLGNLKVCVGGCFSGKRESGSTLASRSIVSAGRVCDGTRGA
jgi:hypothetical protein